MTKDKGKATAQAKQNETMCHLVQQWLPGYLRWELTAVQQQQVKAHLAECDRCAQQVQEARLLANDLQAEADRYQPRLSQAASLRIQRQVYRRMRRSLVWQRTGQVVRLATAVATLILLLGGSFLFGRFWLPFLTNSSATSGDSTPLLEELPPPGPTAVPTTAPVAPEPEIATIVEPPPSLTDPAENGRRINAWDHWVSVAPGQSPEELAALITDTALANDEALLADLFVGMGAAQTPTARMWLSISNRCQDNLSSADFRFIRHPIPLPTVTAVSIWHNSHLVGEIKMRQVQGEWFATFTRTPAINVCLFP